MIYLMQFYQNKSLLFCEFIIIDHFSMFSQLEIFLGVKRGSNHH
jgi:hypothetical protein